MHVCVCNGLTDRQVRGLLTEIQDSEEDGVDFIETQLVLIQKIGIQNYIQLQSESAE